MMEWLLRPIDTIIIGKIILHLSFTYMNTVKKWIGFHFFHKVLFIYEVIFYSRIYIFTINVKFLSITHEK